MIVMPIIPVMIVPIVVAMRGINPNNHLSFG